MADVPDSQPDEQTNIGPCPDWITGEGRRLWDLVAADGYILRGDEVMLLEQVCRQLMLVGTLQDQVDLIIESGEYFVSGSQGQDVINPVISELRMHRALYGHLSRQLNLPDPEPPPPPPAVQRPPELRGHRKSTSEQASQAGLARHRRTRGG